MITLKIVLIGIVTLVPQGPWDDPEKIYVLLNKGGHGHTSDPHDTRHQAMLLFNPEHLAELPGPSTAFLLADRDCSRMPMIAFQPPREAWLFDGLELSFDKGHSPRDATVQLEGLLCDSYTGKAAEMMKPCGKGSPMKQRHDIRALLDVTQLYGKPLPLDPACLLTPVGESCRGALAARLVLDSGQLSTRTLSGERGGQWLEWLFGLTDETLVEGAAGVTFAGSLEVEIQVPDADSMTIYRHDLESQAGDPIPALTLRPRSGEETVVVTIENVPLSERLPDRMPCGSEDELPQALHHAKLLYEFADPRPEMGERKVPRSPVKTGGVGVLDHNPPRCEPPAVYPYTADAEEP